MTDILYKAMEFCSFAFRVIALFVAALLVFTEHSVLIGVVALPIAWSVGEEWDLWWYKRGTDD